MHKVCFICNRPYDDAGDGFGEATHFAFRHSLIAPVAYNGRNATGEWVKVVERGDDGPGVTRHTWNMDFGEIVEPGTENERCIETGCNARRTRGYYCPMHSTAVAELTLR